MAKTYTVAFGSGDPRTYTGLNPTLLIFVNASSGATLVAPAFSEALTGSGIYKFAYGTTTPIAFLADAATTSPGAAARYVVGQIDPADRSDEYGTSMVALGTTAVALGTTTVALGTTTVALGTTSVALGISMVSFGSTLIGYGVTLQALGTTSVAIGTSHIAQGVSITAQGVSILAFGVTNAALGTTAVAIGTSIYAFDQAFGSSFLAFGNSNMALGTSIYSNTGAGTTIEVLIGTTASIIGDSATDPSTLFGYLKRINESILGQETFNKSSGAFTILDRTGATTLASRTITNSASMVTKS